MQKIPAHIAIIMDGNGRWAKARGLDRSMGHQQGVVAVREITAVEAFNEYIASQVLADSIEVADTLPGDAAEFDFEDFKAKMSITR